MDTYLLKTTILFLVNYQATKQMFVTEFGIHDFD